MSSKYTIEILDNNSNLEEWNKFVSISSQGSVFCYSWWLLSACPNGFRIIIVRNKNGIVAGLPLQNEYDEKGREICNMPLLTQTLGILLYPQNGSKTCKYLSETIKIMDEIINNLPHYKYFYMQFHYNFTNWLPFYWKGYSQSTRYTYIVPKTVDIENIFSSFTYAKRCDIRNSKKIVKIKTDISAELFYDHHFSSLKKNGKNIRYSFENFENIYNSAYLNKRGKSWYAVDEEGNIHSIIFCVFDNKLAYYLVSSIDPDYRKTGSISLLIWEAIKYFSKLSLGWNFEGSMRYNIEKSYRQFGGIQVPYFLITKPENKI